MGMVVRTNMAALGANNSLAQASKAQQNGMQKLYTGFKINAAKDDASGLAISEKMKNQIKALDTAKDNCEDGSNMIQTAEGYMKETHDILTRMTELAEKSANGTLGKEDRDALQDEMDQLCGEIDRIATTANFNGHKLLDGSIGGTDSIKLSCVDGEIKYTSPKLDNSALNPTTATGNTNYTVKADTLKPGTYTYKTDHWENSDGETVTVTNGTKPAVGAKVTLDASDGSTPVTEGGIKVSATAADKGKTVTFDGTDWKDSDGNAVSVTVNSITGPSDGDKFTVKEGINLQIGESSTSADRLEVSINSFHTDTLFGGLDKFVNTTNDSTDKAATAAVKIKNSNDASTYNKAVSIDITDKDAASAAADAIRQVSNYVSDERGKLGAQQNRLEHTVNNLTTASENTTASKSRILDTDMAKEMMEYTSKNVIAQAAQSMLAQANSQPQNVLSLLQ
jgi:flagellin